MKEETLQYLKEEIAKFDEMTKLFVDREITMKEYKGFSGGYGSYAQRGGDRFMVRLRMNQGIITKEKLHFIVETLNRYQIDKLHLTTCQTCQLHNVEAEAVAQIMHNALDHDIVMRGGGGDYPRNVMCSPLSGVDPEEYFDVLPYAQAAGEFLLDQIHTFQLPRKLKVAFSNNEENSTHATFRDLGFLANEDHTFDVMIAGGLGNQPKLGVCVAQHIDPNDILYYIQAMVETFMAHGNYENRAKARTRYMQETLGEEGLKHAFHEKLKEVRKLDLKLSIKEQPLTTKQGTGTLEHPYVLPQKQPGLYTIHVHPKGGDVTLSVLRDMDAHIRHMEDVQLRISPQQDLYIVNLTAQEAEELLPLLTCFATTRFERSVSCVGASICQVGLRDSQGLLLQLLEQLRPYQFLDGVLPLLHISGCTSSCSGHQSADLGLQGTVKLVNKQPQSAFIISLCGDAHRTTSCFGEVVGTILEKNIAPLFVAMGKQIQGAQSTFHEYAKQYPQELKALIKAYCDKE